MNRAIQLVCIVFLLTSCDKDDVAPNDSNNNTNDDTDYISAVDISRLPEISNYNPLFYDLNGQPKDFIAILKEHGINTIRLRLWVHPDTEHSEFDEVEQFSETLKQNGLKTWLTLHYSDTWADPGHQEIPFLWQGVSFNALKDSVFQYTQKVVQVMQPDYIQIGNEINSGFLHPQGHITSSPQQFLELMQAGISAVRTHSDSTKIIIHFAGLDGSDWFFNQVGQLDYDIIGLSYYPIWHGKSLNDLKTTMQILSSAHDKEVIIAETAYPFTLDWNDWTNNIVGLESQLILPDYPASMDGQRNFVKAIRLLNQDVDRGIGFCYWGAEMVAWKGPEATDASPWENQALFDFENKALPVLNEFKFD